MTTTVLSFFGVVIGASLQYIFTRYLETQRHRRELRTQAYLDYFQSVSEQVHRDEFQGSQDRDPLGRVADAKARICLYGSREVVHAFAVFEELGAMISSVPQRRLLSQWLQQCAQIREMQPIWRFKIWKQFCLEIVINRIESHSYRDRLEP